MSKIGANMVTSSVHIQASDRFSHFEIEKIIRSEKMVLQMEACGAEALFIKGTNGSLRELDNAAKLLGEKDEAVRFGDVVIVFCHKTKMGGCDLETKDISICAGVFLGLFGKHKEERTQKKKFETEAMKQRKTSFA